MRLTEEGRYRMTMGTHGLCLIFWLVLGGVSGWLFYDNIKTVLIFLPFYPLFGRAAARILERRLRRRMQEEFKDVMISVYSSLAAGATVEQSFQRGLKDMEKSLKPGSRMVTELDLVCRKMAGNVPISQCLEEMAERCGDSDIENFVQILNIGKRQGSHLAGLVKTGVEKIQRRIEINYEIEGLIGAKRSEFGFMCLIPAGIIFYMRMFSPEFMAVLYGNPAGIFAMTLCLAVYGMAVAIGLAILNIHI